MIRAHAGYVADVVADVIGDNPGVTRIVFREYPASTLPTRSAPTSALLV